MIQNVRQFKLINANGQEYDMTRPEALFHNPQGLGWGEEATITTVGNGYFASDKRIKQPNPSGEMIFRTYKEYDGFIDFCQAGGLVLCYKPRNVWRYLDVIISIEKSEIDHRNRHLVCPVSFTATSYWYEKITAIKSAQGDSAGKTYPYTYPYTYSSGRPGTIDIVGGNLPSSCKIHIFGPCTNPAFTLTKEGKRVADGRVFVDLQEGRKLVINSDPVEMEIAEYTTDNEYIADRYSNSDFETDRVVQLPAGESRFTFTQDGSGFVTAFVEVKKLV